MPLRVIRQARQQGGTATLRQRAEKMDSRLRGNDGGRFPIFMEITLLTGDGSECRAAALE